MDFKEVIRCVPDFPSKGVLFRDITPLLNDPKYLQIAIDSMAEKIKDIDFDLIIGPESRGFIFGMPLAYKLNKGFIPARKPGKLPFTTVKKHYTLEYGVNTIEMHIDAIKPGQKVIIVDDLLATGGTCKTLAELVTEMGGKVVALEFFIEIASLNGRKQLEDYDNVISIVQYDN